MLRSDVLIALPLIMELDYDDAAGIDLDQATGDVGSFIVPFKCEVVLAGAVVTETCAGGDSTPVVKFDKRDVAGSDGVRGDGDIAELKFLTAAAGTVLYDEVAVGEVLEPGEEVIIQLTVAAVGEGLAGHMKPFLLVKQLPETKANMSNMSATT